MLKIKILWIVLVVIVSLIGAVWWIITPSEKQRVMFAEEEQRRCLDKFCQGDIVPKSSKDEILLKINNQWFIGPRDYSSMGRRGYFSMGRGGAVFFWSKKESDFGDGKYYDFNKVAIEIFFRSYAIPPEPRGYARIEKFEKEGRVLERKTLRKGLDSLRIKGDDGNLSTYTTYVATELKGFDGLPPVVACGPPPINDASTGFFWHYGVYVDIRMHTQHCADWPEIYQEIQRVIQLLKKVEQ